MILRTASFVTFAAGLALAGVWALQELGLGAWLEHPDSAAMAMLLLGLTLYLLDRQRRESAEAGDPGPSA